MKHDDYDNLNEGARTRTRAKRRKTNLILNSLIVVVILLIAIVSFNIFFSNDEGAADNSDVTAENNNAASSGKKDNKDDSKGTADKDNESADSNNEDDSTGEESEDADEESEDSEELGEPVVTEGGSDANVKQTIENPHWEPVGTTQSGEHATVFDQNSVDWQEMILAYSYATGIDKNNMTVWWNENGGAPNTARGTVSEKGGDQAYRVIIQWVDGQGWKPVKIEELIQNDKR
ncbi:YrrS family protein [Mesobacillus subterraneus]|uniref:YrrS family protein n=1 Tax=Mesobacillus subterraneus TaxID=285983 RepID=UPI00203CD9E1|nr:YrrS family protein [Mesobacillus subterraneus]MCM3663907.1 YrrS family protein [Mesobacillus subterraneus]MCM3683667.1 YrrS family protein [Mesobacillus subterraneus]